MADIQRLEKLKEKAAKLEKDVSRAEGALAESVKTLKKEFGCSNLAEAKKLLVKLQKEETKAVKDYDESFAEFEEKWGDFLDE